MTHGLSFLLCCLLGASAMAHESFYTVNSKANRETLEFSYTLVNSDYIAEGFGNDTRASTRSHMVGLEFRRELDDNQSFWIGTQLVGGRISLDNDTQFNGIGLSDINLGYQRGEMYGFMMFFYGLSGSLSPGPAQDPRLSRVEHINNFFSGSQSLAPYVGIQAYSGSVAIGAVTEVSVYSDIQYEEQGKTRVLTNPDRFIPKLKGFIEVPLARSWSWGLEAAVSRNTFAADQLLFGGAGNQYEAMMYNQWKIEQNTVLMAAVTSKDQKYPLPESQIDVSLGLRKEM